MKSLWWVSGLTVVAAAATVWWLPSCSDNSCQGASCANPDSGGAPSISGGGCDSSKPPSQGGCAVADSDGFFVSPSGSDAADGSKATPFKTLGKGISAAAASPAKANVYVCAGTFAENLTIQNAPQGVALHGGFSCADWSPGGGTTAVAPAYAAGNNPQYVLRVLGAAALVEAMTLTAPDATDPGASSIAAFVDTSPGMTFRRATVTAGKAADGVSPAQVAQLAANTAGNNASANIPGAEQKCNCTTDFTIGGHGGYYDGGVPISAEPGLPFINGIDAGGITNGAGSNGANGLDQTPANSTNVLGELTSNGWTPAPGGPGATGGTAQGGAGGNLNPGNGFGGSGGGCGGCGGAGGAGGGGGGASIAVAALNTTLRIQASTLHGGTAGNGGNGAYGQLGQPGGAGGTTNFAGGAGGTGGNGGAGGGGAGGVSLGIAAFNTTPDIDAQSSVLGGKAGTGGNNGASPPTSKAIDGVAEAFHTF